ncbi:MAG TPA: Maf family protein [Steroidobacteraceae bacterium]|nr:Maf family protein [Steroidobacteraceae bacterium]
MGEKRSGAQPRPVIRLASASPRRRQLLELIGVPHVVSPGDIDETPRAGERPDHYVMRLACEKAKAIWETLRDLPVLGADTTVVIDEVILGKPESEADAIAMLTRLSGRVHVVHTGMALRMPDGREFMGISTTQVQFAHLAEAQMRAYWASGEPQGKAGAYAIQGLGAVFVSGISGSYTGVMGLPLYEAAEMLRAAGVAVWQGARR